MPDQPTTQDVPAVKVSDERKTQTASRTNMTANDSRANRINKRRDGAKEEGGSPAKKNRKKKPIRVSAYR